MSEAFLVPGHPRIPSIVARHAGDAAFYWSQWDASAHSPLVGLAQLAEFERLLTGHLEGLRTAGPSGWDKALGELRRWQAAGEVFVCAVLALESSAAGQRLQAVWAVVERDPRRMLRGLISAFAWSDEQHARPWVEHWLSETQVPAALQVAAWRMAWLMRGVRPSSAALEQALSSPHAMVRAAACRSLGTNIGQLALAVLLRDDDCAVRAEAAIAAGGLGDSSGVSTLWQAVAALSHEYAGLTGRPRRDAQRRLDRWIRHLALLLPLGHSGVADLLGALPPRQALLFVLHHGDCHYLPWVLEYLEHPDVARLAGWVWAMLTGVDLEREALCYPTVPLEGEPRPTDNLDPGLPDPDGTRIRAYSLVPPVGYPALLGQPLVDAQLSMILREAPQALRWIASWRLKRGLRPRLNNRARLAEQTAQLAMSAETSPDAMWY